MKPVFFKSLLLSSLMAGFYFKTAAQPADPGPSPDIYVKGASPEVTHPGISAFLNRDKTITVNRKSADKIKISAYRSKETTRGIGFTRIYDIIPSYYSSATARYAAPATLPGHYAYYRRQAPNANGPRYFISIK